MYILCIYVYTYVYIYIHISLNTTSRSPLIYTPRPWPPSYQTQVAWPAHIDILGPWHLMVFR